MTILDKRLHAARPDLADSRLRGRVEAERFVDGRPARAAREVVPLRRRPAPDAPLDTEILFGEALRVFEETVDGWSWVQLDGDGYVGWTPSAGLSAGEGEAPTHRVRVPRTLVFPEPDIKRPPLGALPLGALVTGGERASDRNADYLRIAPDGWVVVQHLAPAGETVGDFVAVAERFAGVPYLWGGKSALGVDCSGLVQVALSMAGRAAPRDTDMQQAGLGTALEPDAGLRRGDLVFWPGHVGVMLDETRVLHANAHHMLTAAEPLAETVARLEAKGVPVSSVRRLTA